MNTFWNETTTELRDRWLRAIDEAVVRDRHRRHCRARWDEICRGDDISAEYEAFTALAEATTAALIADREMTLRGYAYRTGVSR